MEAKLTTNREGLPGRAEQGRKPKFSKGQVVALREADGAWIYAKIYEFVADGTARLIDVDGRRKLRDLRPLNKREVGR
jgi:hypothetical protein